MTTQVQVRGAVTATQSARTLATREIDIDTTLKRLNLHDGSTAGGIPHLNYADDQNQTFTYAAASGTNTITISLAKAPAAYAAGQRFTFKAANTISGSATLNVNSLGAVTLKKKNVNGGTIDALAAGDIIAGGIYTALVLDSSNALIESVDSGGIVSVSQGDLNTTNGSFGTNNISGSDLEIVIRSNITANFSIIPSIGLKNTNGSLRANYTLPGGEYGFYPLVAIADISGSADFSGTQRYMDASPPFDMGDGEAAGFFFALVNTAGEITSYWIANVPPWGYNGPTSIKASHKCKVTGKKYRIAMKQQTLEQIMDGAEIEYEYQEITQALKNADMSLIPHPFGVIPPGHRVVLLDPMSDKVRRLIEYQNAGGIDFIDAIKRGEICTEDTPLKRKGPQGVKITPLIFRK